MPKLVYTLTSEIVLNTKQGTDLYILRCHSQVFSRGINVQVSHDLTSLISFSQEQQIHTASMKSSKVGYFFSMTNLLFIPFFCSLQARYLVYRGTSLPANYCIIPLLIAGSLFLRKFICMLGYTHPLQDIFQFTPVTFQGVVMV